MAYLGDITIEDTVDFYFSTVGTTGAPATLSGTPVVSAYVGNSTTQITAGITLDVDFDTVTGLNHVRVAATAANGYTTGTNVSLVITTGTVGGTSVVGYVVGAFSIGARSAFARIGANGAGLTDLATASLLTTVAGYLDTEIAAILADTNELQTDWANGGRLDLILDARASQTSVDTVDGIVDAIKAKTDSLTFTVAGQVDANIESVNGATVNGTGTPGDEWGP